MRVSLEISEEELLTLTRALAPLAHKLQNSRPPESTQVPIEAPAFLDVSQAAEHMNVSERFVHRIIHENRVPYVKLGKERVAL